MYQELKIMYASQSSKGEIKKRKNKTLIMLIQGKEKKQKKERQVNCILRRNSIQTAA